MFQIDDRRLVIAEVSSRMRPVYYWPPNVGRRQILQEGPSEQHHVLASRVRYTYPHTTDPDRRQDLEWTEACTWSE
jgi:hypothetical protein